MEPTRIAALSAAIFAAFEVDAAATPSMSLRAGNAVDDGSKLPPTDKEADAPADNYLEQYYWGLPHLDAESWRHVLPFLLDYALRHIEHASDAVDGLLNSLRPPDRMPPRLASLSLEQERIVAQVLDVLCYSPESAYHELACQATEEWWEPNAMYRPSPNDA
ncbi:DUF6714 family protein [Roseateles oligotrophus]|uniref:DUF6714 family protein n=1 Tax=Roseateles oligotrophus TaxID=1769250 RepID=UPI0039647CC8